MLSGAVSSPARLRGSRCVAAERSAPGGGRADSPRGRSVGFRVIARVATLGGEVRRGGGGDAAGVGPGASGMREVPVRPAPRDRAVHGYTEPGAERQGGQSLQRWGSPLGRVTCGGASAGLCYYLVTPGICAGSGVPGYFGRLKRTLYRQDLEQKAPPSPKEPSVVPEKCGAQRSASVLD